MKANMDRTVRGSALAAIGRGRLGFTLIELLTIIVILGTLISLTTPSILEVKKIFSTRESTARMAQLEYGIKMYSIDWKEYPPSAPNKYPKASLKGRTGLVQALNGYLPKGTGHGDGDGADGLGSRKTVPGKVFGPYASDMPTGLSDPLNPSSDPAFTDAFGNNFYYFRAISSGTGSAAKMKYEVTHNDYDATNSPGTIPSFDTYYRPRQDTGQAPYRVDYILISPGADRAWETFPAPVTGVKKKTKTDDIANFEFQFK